MYFISDLDHTLIYPKYECSGDIIPIEYIRNVPINFMTNTAFSILSELCANEDFSFIPCSIRAFSQVNRLSFIQANLPKFMICENGGRIYIDGKEDNNYREYVKHTFNLTHDRTRKTIDTIREACMYVYPPIANVKLSVSRKKKDFPSDQVNKAVAVKYLIEKYHLTDIITSGDSQYDKSFTSLGDKILLPKHATFSYENAFVSEHTGVKACEDILHELYRLYNNQA